MHINLNNDEILFLNGNKGIIGIIKVGYKKMLYIGTPDKDEIVQFLESDDIIAISGFECNEKTKKGIRAQAYLTREMDTPIIVLDKNHPSSKRLPLVLSIGEKVKLDCTIQPGTHPEQDILCSCDSLNGLLIEKTSYGIKINKEDIKYEIEKF